MYQKKGDSSEVEIDTTETELEKNEAVLICGIKRVRKTRSLRQESLY